MDLERVIALWHDKTLRTDEIAAQIGCRVDTLYKVAARHGLPKRIGAKTRRKSFDDGTEITWRDPTPDEIERMKEELWQKKLARMRAETPQETADRVLRELSEAYAE